MPFLRSKSFNNFTRDSLLKMDPEIAHQATIAALKMGLVPEQKQADSHLLTTNICGLQLKNPIGMAAGFDKNGEVISALNKIGFGFSEIGTITPKPQQGNIKPRLFRLMKAQAIINRMGFNNQGHKEIYQRLKGQGLQGIVGINIGANKDSTDFVADYVKGVKKFAPIADYLSINISSPNTKGLRDLQSSEALKQLLFEVLAERARAKIRVPVFLKLAPDLEEKTMDEIAKTILASDLDGLIISNTTISREMVQEQEHSEELGGLSGKPLFNLATKRLAQMRLRVGNEMAIIGVGGIHCANSAIAKLNAGANVIQLYSALVFSGMELIEEIKQGLISAIKLGKHKNISALSGTNTKDWASGKLEI